MSYNSGAKASRNSRRFSGSRGGFSSKSGTHSFHKKRGQNGFSSSNRSQKNTKRFDPSLFIQRVEERVVAPEFKAQHTFADFNLVAQLQQNIISRGYITPTAIQDKTIPLLLKGHDLIGTANTGTGKTAAFLIPLINALSLDRTKKALVVAPTRELAMQIQQELRLFAQKLSIYSVLCIGGANIRVQINQLYRSPNVVIGTPGRLIDLERNGYLDFTQFTTIVLDEVDMMLDMGFITDVRSIITKLPHERHSLFFSATIPPKLSSLMSTFLRNPVTVSVKARQSAENVNQTVMTVDPQAKIDTLHDVLIAPTCKKSIIFVRTKHAADKLSAIMNQRGFKLSTIHGNKSQAQRKKALDAFKYNKVTILLATDVIARGIDIDDVSHVINYDVPQTYEDYIHRIGRTGRAGNIGQAITFIEKYAPKLRP